MCDDLAPTSINGVAKNIFNPIETDTSKLEIDGVPKKFFNDVAHLMRTQYDSPIIAKVIEKFADTLSSNPFELLIYEHVTQFKNLTKNLPGSGYNFAFIHDTLKNEEEKDKSKKNLSEAQKGAQRLMNHVSTQTFTDANLWINYKERSKGLNPLRFLAEQALFTYYFQNNPNVVFSNMTGAFCLNGKSPKDKILLFTPLANEVPTTNIKSYVSSILAIQNYVHSKSRPKAIIIPLGVNDPKTGSHATVLIVEPSADVTKKAQIFMINTHGDSLDWHRKDEEQALLGAKYVYSDLGTIAWRNTEKLWATASCTHNTLDIIRTIIDQMSSGKTLKELSLPKATANLDKASSIQHGEDLKKFLDSYK